MTEKTQPKDAELDMLIDEVAGLDSSDEVFREFARAVLAKWGTPQQEAGEPAQWQKRHALRTNGEWENTNEHDAKWWRDNSQGWEIRALYTTPQPSPTAQSAEPVAWLDPWTGTKVTTDYDAYGKHGIPLYTAPQPVAREPLPKFLALKFHARRDKKATVTLLFPGHEAADAWVRGIKGGQHDAE